MVLVFVYTIEKEREFFETLLAKIIIIIFHNQSNLSNMFGFNISSSQTSYTTTT